MPGKNWIGRHGVSEAESQTISWDEAAIHTGEELGHLCIRGVLKLSKGCTLSFVPLQCIEKLQAEVRASQELLSAHVSADLLF